MARPYRFQRANCVYHITSRGDDRRKIYDSDRDFDKFLEYLERAKRKYRFYIYAYCLMTNHYHLLIETSRPNISDVMHYINGSYTTYVNIKRKRFGHVFQGRYKSLVVDKETYFLKLTRYIHLNPVKAKMVKWPHEYRWSSYKGYLGKGDSLLDHERIKQNLGMGRGEYRQYVNDGIDIEEDLFEKIYAGFLLGSVAFIREKLKEIKKHMLTKGIAYRDKIVKVADIDMITHEVEKAYGRDIGELFDSKYRHDIARKVAMYLTWRFADSTGAGIGMKFGVSSSCVGVTARNLGKMILSDPRLKKRIARIISRLSVK